MNLCRPPLLLYETMETAETGDGIKLSFSIAAVGSAGLISDSRTLVERAQLEATNYWFVYDRPIRVTSFPSLPFAPSFLI